MPRQNQQYEDVMTSIFGFLFEQSQKSPDNVRPVKTPGSSRSRKTQAIDAALAMPLTFISDPMIDAVNEAADIELPAFNVGGRKSDTMKISLFDFLKDPSGSIDKKFATMEAIRKANRITIYGEQISALIAGAWGLGKGLDSEATVSLYQAVKTASGSRSESDKSTMISRNHKLIDKYIPTVPDTVPGLRDPSFGAPKKDKDLKSSEEGYLVQYNRVSEEIKKLEQERLDARHRGDSQKVSEIDKKIANARIDYASFGELSSISKNDYLSRIIGSRMGFRVKESDKKIDSIRNDLKDAYKKKNRTKVDELRKKLFEEKVRRKQYKILSTKEEGLGRIDKINMNFRFGDAEDPFGKKLSDNSLNLYKSATLQIQKAEGELREAIAGGESDKIAEKREKLRDTRNKLAGNVDLYILLEGQELLQKAKNTINEAEKWSYIKSTRLVDNVVGSNKLKQFVASRKELKNKYLKKIEELKGVGGNEGMIKECREKIAEIDSQVNYVRGVAFGRTLGEVEGYWYTFKDYLIDGNLLKAVFDGTFFDHRRNRFEWIQPSQTKNVEIGRKMKKGKKVEEIITIETHVGKITGNPIRDELYEKMNAVYYLTPGTMVRSLFNGESFSYLLERGRKKFEKNIIKALKEKLSKEMDENFMNHLLKNRNGIMSLLDSNLVDLENNEIFKNLPEDLQTIFRDKEMSKLLAEFMKKDGKLQNLAYLFSTVQRAKDSVKKFLDEKILKKVRNEIGKVLLRNVAEQKVKDAINTWITNGGVMNLVRAVVTKIATGIGIATTGLGGIVIGAVTWVVTGLVYRIIKPIVKIAGESAKLGIEIVVYGTLSFVLLLLLLFGSFYFIFYGQHTHIAPGDCVDCGTWEIHAHEYRYGPEPEEEADGDCPNCLTNIHINDSSHGPSKARVISIIDAWTQTCPKGGYPEICYEDVYCRALKYGIDPAFAFTIWSNESGGSNYAHVANVQDFGINIAAIEADFDAQIEDFLQNKAPPGYAAGCDWKAIDTQGLDTRIIQWGTRFLTGACSTVTTEQLVRGRDYMLKINEIYGWYTGNSLSWPFTVSANPGACNYSSARVNNIYNSCDQKAQGTCNGSTNGGGGGGGGGSPGGRLYTCVGGESINDVFLAVRNKLGSIVSLNTQLELIECPGHTMCTSIGGAWCYSADKVYCKRKELESSSCNYVSDLMCHELVHQIQGRKGGFGYSYEMREWGADYVCMNGGNYWFQYEDSPANSCERATAIRLPSQCTTATAQFAAYNDSGAGACYGAIRNKITKVCGIGSSATP
jgi:hypothetical protein